MTPLHYACSVGNLKMLKILIDYGADVTRTSHNGDSILKSCMSSGNMQAYHWMKRLIEQQNEHRRPDPESQNFHAATKAEELFHAARKNNFDKIEELVKVDKVDPNVEDSHGWTALTLAAYEGQANAVNKLVELGADINKAERDGWTPLMFAANKV